MDDTPAGGLRINPTKFEISQIKLIDKNVDHTNRIVLANPILNALGEQRALPPILALNEPSHPTPPQIAGAFPLACDRDAPLLHLSWFALRQLGLNDDLNFVVLAVICLPLIVATSYGFHCVFERPFMRLKPKPVKAPGLAPAVQDVP